MLEWIKKGLYIGLGLALITKEKVEELAKELVTKGELSEKEGKSFIEEILKKSEEAKQELEKKTETLINQALKKTDILSRKDFISVSRRLAKLEEKIEELKKEITEK